MILSSLSLANDTAEHNQILQLSDVWPGYNNLAQETKTQIRESEFINRKAS